MKSLFIHEQKPVLKHYLKKGPNGKETVREVAEQSDVIITMVGYPHDVKEIYLGKDGIIHNAKKGCYTIDMTTSSPILAREIYQAAKEKHIHALDAPVSGGDIGGSESNISDYGRRRF